MEVCEKKCERNLYAESIKGHEELVQKVEEPQEEKWSWVKFFKGKLNNKFIAFNVTSAIIIWVLASGMLMKLSVAFEIGIIVVWGVAVLIYMLAGAIDNAVYNAQIKAQMNTNFGATVGKQKTTTTDTAEVIRAVKGG